MNFYSIFEQVKEFESKGKRITASWQTTEVETPTSHSRPVISIEGEEESAFSEFKTALRDLIFYELSLPYNNYLEKQEGSGILYTENLTVCLRYNNSIYSKKGKNFILEEIQEDAVIVVLEEEALYTFVHKHIANGASIRAHWEGGGDSTYIRFELNGEPANHRNKRFEELRWMIQSEIGIPNSGENYNIGYGDIFIDEKCIYIVTNFNYFERYPDQAPSIEYQVSAIRFPQLSDLSSHLKRSQVQVHFKISNNKPYTLAWHMQVRNGDAWEFNEDQKTHIVDVLADTITDLQALLLKEYGEFELEEISLILDIIDFNTVRARLEPEFIKIMKRAKEELYILYEKKGI
jgi:hypothetical protein